MRWERQQEAAARHAPPRTALTRPATPSPASEAFQKYLGTILQLMLTLLQRGLQGKVVRPFLGFVGRLIGKHGPGPFLEALTSIQATCVLHPPPPSHL